MQHTIQSSNQYLTNDQIVVAGVLALSPLGIIGIPNLLVHRKKTGHLAFNLIPQRNCFVRTSFYVGIILRDE